MRVARAHARHLRASGLRVLIAHTARDALRRAASDEPDGFLLDVRLPDGDGLALARAIRKLRGLAPILVISGIRSERTQNALAALAAWYAHKPVTKDVYEPLIAAVQRSELTPAATQRPLNALLAFIADKALTRAELRTLVVTLRAESNEDAARELGIRIDTHKKHISKILHKCGGAPNLRCLAGQILTAQSLPPQRKRRGSVQIVLNGSCAATASRLRFGRRGPCALALRATGRVARRSTASRVPPRGPPSGWRLRALV